ncbi:MAG: YwhD family protein [Alicyclobacillaceae bacterium]|uniref:YwhD family protein n=1 Tax=Alicyclobacillus sp. SP_1 TaxID=2942475 RepID=UPI0021577BE6|nr:YwhD family protein [Alicyclobacillus sp. SP_1]MCY0887602.1 YwhD family protein [Alicyclobacillaceae bacterium]
MQKLSLTGQSKHSTDEQLRGLSVLFVDGDDVFIDNGAIHGKSRLETGIKFVKDKSDVPNGRTILGLWLTLHRFPEGQGLYGAMPFELVIDDKAGLGYKNLAVQVNGMDKAVRGQVEVSALSPEQKQKILDYLRGVRSDLWDNAAPDFRTAFAPDAAIKEGDS